MTKRIGKSGIPIPQRDIKDEFKQIFGDRIVQRTPFRVGHPLTKEVFVDNDNMRLWIHPDGADPQVVYQAANGLPGVTMGYGLRVMVERRKAGWRVVEVDTSTPDSALSQRGFTAPPSVDIDQLHYATIQPTSPPTMQVWVTEFKYGYGGTIKRSKPFLSADFSDSPLDVNSAAIDIPSTPNQTRLVLIQLNPATGTFSYKQSSVLDASNTIRQAFSQVPQPSAKHIPVGVIGLPNGVTELVHNPYKIDNGPFWYWLFRIQDLLGVGDLSGITDGQGLVFDSGTGLFIPGDVGGSSGVTEFTALDDVNTTGAGLGALWAQNADGDQQALPLGTNGQILRVDTSDPRRIIWDDESGSSADISYDPAGASVWPGTEPDDVKEALDRLSELLLGGMNAMVYGSAQTTTTPSAYFTLRYTSVIVDKYGAGAGGANINLGVDDENIVARYAGLWRVSVNVEYINTTTDSYINLEFTVNGSTASMGIRQIFIPAGFTYQYNWYQDLVLSATDQVSIRIYNFSSTNFSCEHEVTMRYIGAS